MLSKIDKHHVDCDKATGAGGSWTYEQGGYYGDYKLTYVSENGNIWGIPIYDTTASGLTTGESVVDNEDGTVSLPFTGHPFEDGWVVKISNTTGTLYDGIYTIQAGSTGTNNIVVTETYNAYTCTGNERVIRWIDVYTSSAGSSVQDSDGNVYYGHNDDGTSHVTKITEDGTQSYPLTATTYPWPRDGYSCVDIGISGDSIYTWLDKSTGNHVTKFSLSTGIEEWNNFFTGAGVPDFALDSDGNLYAGTMGTGTLYGGAGGGTEKRVAKFASADGTKTDVNFPRMKTCYETYIDNELGIIICAGNDYYVSTDSTNAPGWNVQVADLDGSNWRGIRFGGITIVGGGPAYDTDYTIGKDQVWTYNGYIWVIVQAEEKLYQLDTDCNIVDSVTVTGVVGGWYDLWGNIVLVSPGETNIFTWLDSGDISGGALAVEPDDNYDNLLSAWDSAFVYIRGNAFFWPGIDVPASFVAPGSRQYRSIAYPEDWAHLEGQTVQVVKDGIYLGDEAVSGGQITLDD